MPRPKRLDPTFEYRVQIPESLKVKLDLYCFSSMRGKPEHGKRSELIVQLLREFFDKQAALTSTPGAIVNEPANNSDDPLANAQSPDDAEVWRGYRPPSGD